MKPCREDEVVDDLEYASSGTSERGRPTNLMVITMDRELGVDISFIHPTTCRCVSDLQHCRLYCNRQSDLGNVHTSISPASAQAIMRPHR